MELFVFEKSNDLVLPSSYENYESLVTGIFTTSSVRFYEKSIESIIKYESIKKKHPELSSKEIRMLLRHLYSLLESFKINEEGKVKMVVDGTEHKRKFKFSKGMIIVKGEHFIDVTNKDILHNYLENYGFDCEYEKEILKEKIVTLHRNPKKKLTYYFE